MAPAQPPAVKLTVDGLAVGFGPVVVQHDVSFAVRAGSIFAIMGASGCGKSTVLKALIGLLRPSAGAVRIDGEDYWAADEARRGEIDQGFGVLFQEGALWSAMTALENVALPLQMLAHLDGGSIETLARVKLALVGLDQSADVMPADLSGGMIKRVGLARALALDPAMLFLDEPSAGLDPIASRRLDELILELRDGFGMTIVMVSHELASLFGICDDGVFLDGATGTVIARGAPSALRDGCAEPTVHAFMHRERSTETVTSPGVADGRR